MQKSGPGSAHVPSILTLQLTLMLYLLLSYVYPEVDFYTRVARGTWNFLSVLTSKLADTYTS